MSQYSLLHFSEQTGIYAIVKSSREVRLPFRDEDPVPFQPLVLDRGVCAPAVL